ncbi:hypothetical protein QMK33_17385 [Hymenobacter sp. H14-R3]|uniref:hypothetical protein n=1 Tax=Hymenobacter sp. H14-R3 TaxID=3046308 RepID=UPI0024B9CD19|nr:hypothetical protein [Hymenobacter sp. H14-R3]MDJ0366927.1 hypothetical protein [Hymenobacter sp. H14-R3]
MPTRVLAYIAFIAAVCWTLFASWLLIITVLDDPQHAWLSIGLMSLVIIPTTCTALYVYRTSINQRADANAQVPLGFTNNLEGRLHQFQWAQQAFFNHLGISRCLTNGKMSAVAQSHYKHGRGMNDIPVAYPDVLDYQQQQWVEAYTERNATTEIRVKLDNSGEWEPSNQINFHMLALWQQEGLVCAVCSHLPKPAELAYAPADAALGGEVGTVLYGNTGLLLLNPALGFRKT